MQPARKKPSPREKILGSLLEMIGVIVVASGFLKPDNLFLEGILIIGGLLIFILGVKFRIGMMKYKGED